MGAAFNPRTVALVGLGEAGSAIATGLCAPGGWRDGAGGRLVIGIDTALGDGTRGRAMAARIAALGVPASREYGEALRSADLVISVVTGVEAAAAATMARPWLARGTLYADFNSITGPQTKAVATLLEAAGADFVDVAVMGAFMATGHRTPLLISGPRASDLGAFAAVAGMPASLLNDRVGDASAVKILRSVLIKGLEALSVECLVAARRQGLVEQVLANVADVDTIGFARMLELLTISHLTHAKRRMEEVEKAIQNLDETGVPALMSDATRRSHRRTVEAGIDPGEVAGIDLEAALALLDARVVGRQP